MFPTMQINFLLDNSLITTYNKDPKFTERTAYLNWNAEQREMKMWLNLTLKRGQEHLGKLKCLCDG